jgi:hypothetical protein
VNAIQIAFDQLRVVTVRIMPGGSNKSIQAVSVVAGATLE